MSIVRSEAQNTAPACQRSRARGVSARLHVLSWYCLGDPRTPHVYARAGAAAGALELLLHVLCIAYVWNACVMVK